MVAKEFSECIPNAMRAVLLGELPEMKEAMQFIVKCKQFNVQSVFVFFFDSSKSFCTYLLFSEEQTAPSVKCVL